MNQIIKQNTDIILLVVLTAFIGLGFILEYNFAFYVVLFLSSFGFISILFPPISADEPDERDWFVHGKASAISFAATIIVVSIASLGLDSIEPLKELPPKALMQILLVFLFTFYLAVYAILKRRF